MSKASGFFKTLSGSPLEIREVWASNLEEEMENIQDILEKYPYVAMVCLHKSPILLEVIVVNTILLTKYESLTVITTGYGISRSCCTTQR